MVDEPDTVLSLTVVLAVQMQQDKETKKSPSLLGFLLFHFGISTFGTLQKKHSVPMFQLPLCYYKSNRFLPVINNSRRISTWKTCYTENNRFVFQCS